MLSKTMPYFEFRKGVFEIDEFDCGSIFVVVGEDRALLLDMGTGIGDLKWVLENRITDKPYDVAVTHNHGDHIGGAGWFEKIWIHPADMDWSDPSVAPSMKFRKSYAETIRSREDINYAYNPDTDIRPWPKTPELLPLQDGQVFDLGGRKVTAYHCPGHTAGEMVFIDDLTHTLLCGDAFNRNWLMDNRLAPTSRECAEISLKAMKRIDAMHDHYNSVYNSHHDFRGFGSPLPGNVMSNLIRCLENLLNGTAVFKEIPDQLSTNGETKNVAVYENVCISYLSGRIEPF